MKNDSEGDYRLETSPSDQSDEGTALLTDWQLIELIRRLPQGTDVGGILGKPKISSDESRSP